MRVSTLLSAAAILAAADALAPATSAAETMMAPLQPVIQQVGARDVMAVFTPEAGLCAVTVMIDEGAEAREAMGVPYIPAARLRLALEPAASATVDGANGESLRLTCGAGAGVMTADMRSAADQKMAAAR